MLLSCTRSLSLFIEKFVKPEKRFAKLEKRKCWRIVAAKNKDASLLLPFFKDLNERQEFVALIEKRITEQHAGNSFSDLCGELRRFEAAGIESPVIRKLLMVRCFQFML
jgi:hypothetical protein